MLLLSNIQAREFGVGPHKKWVYFVRMTGSSWSAFCRCDELGYTVEIPLQSSQVVELLWPCRRALRDVIPGVPEPLREIFLTGMTPAEFDRRVKGHVLEEEEYRKFGYSMTDTGTVDSIALQLELRVRMPEFERMFGDKENEFFSFQNIEEDEPTGEQS